MRRTVLVVAALLALGSVAFAGVLLATERAPRERVAGLEVEAVVAPSGDVAVTEEFAWDFDTATRRQILRTIPTAPAAGRSGWVPISEVAAASNTASPALAFEPTGGVEVVVIGTPDQRLTGTHEYRLAYTLGSVVAGEAGDATVELDLVGTLSDVPIEGASASVRVPGELLGGDGAVVATVGGAGSRTRLATEIARDGAATVVRVGPVDLDPAEGISMRIRYEAPVDPLPPVLERRPTTLTDAALSAEGLATEVTPPPALGSPVALFLLLPPALLAGAGAGWGTVRRWGRDRRWAGSAVDAVFGPGEGRSTAEVPVSEREAHHLVTVAFAPPPSVTPGEGGALWRLRVGTEDRVATLVDLAVRGWLVIDESRPTAPQLLWRGAGDESALSDGERHLLAGLFGSGTALPSKGAGVAVSLGTYTPAFAAVWQELGRGLDPRRPERAWLRAGSGWRALAAVGGGLVVALAGALICLLLAGARLPGSLPIGWAVVVPPALAFGVGLGSMLAAGGMRSRAPRGFAIWAGVEGFRQFIVGSDAQYSHHAAEHGLLRPYVAWAVAFGEVERWERACVAAGVDPGEGWVVGGGGLGLTLAALTRDVGRTSTAPSSSGGGGGGFSGSVGGGAGGGGFSSR